jgi:hypothetical protein
MKCEARDRHKPQKIRPDPPLVTGDDSTRPRRHPGQVNLSLSRIQVDPKSASFQRGGPHTKPGTRSQETTSCRVSPTN